MIKTVTLNRNQQPTEEQIRQIEEAAKREIVFDEDSPALTPAMEKAFRLFIFYIIHHHHGQLKRQRILKSPDIQPELFLQLLETVHQCISVHIKLP